MKSKRATLFTALLWTAITLIWAGMTAARFLGPDPAGDPLALAIFTTLLSFALCVFFWVRFARYGKK